MGEDVNINPKLFELPTDGHVKLPDFEEITEEEVPKDAWFLINSDMGAIETTSRKRINGPVKLDFKESGTVYVIEYDFESGLDVFAKFRGIFTADMSKDGQEMGSGYSLSDLDEADRESVRPYIGHTFTKPSFERQGLGLRRLLIINEASKRWLGDTVGSGQFAVEEGSSSHANNIWQLLNSEGYAVKEGEGFRFKD